MMLDSDLVHLSDSYDTMHGLHLMLAALCHQEEADMEAMVRSWMEVKPLLLVIAMMHRAEDKPEWFPRGKWATIQTFQDRADRAITQLLLPPNRRIP